jgi:uncharacterized membrane protein
MNKSDKSEKLSLVSMCIGIGALLSLVLCAVLAFFGLFFLAVIFGFACAVGLIVFFVGIIISLFMSKAESKAFFDSQW